MAEYGKKKKRMNSQILIIDNFYGSFLLILCFVLRTNRWSGVGILFGTS